MFLLKKILTPFLLPPGIFIVILLFSGLWFLYKKHRKAALLNLATGFALWLLAVAPVSDALMQGLESRYQIPKDPQGDVIILLGGGVYDGVEDFSGIGAPSDDMLSRIITAVRLQKKMNIPIIISGGAVFPGHPSEALIDKRVLTDLGVPTEKIILEEKSRDTFGNAQYTKAICERYQFKKPLLVTSAYHMDRAVWSFRKFNVDVTPFPANFHTWKDKKYFWNDYLPGNMKSTYMALHEYLGRLFYKISY
jgi:uncharacterized SAM-binding protein YcdF (DUF218 family)